MFKSKEPLKKVIWGIFTVASWGLVVACHGVFAKQPWVGPTLSPWGRGVLEDLQEVKSGVPDLSLMPSHCLFFSSDIAPCCCFSRCAYLIDVRGCAVYIEGCNAPQAKMVWKPFQVDQANEVENGALLFFSVFFLYIITHALWRQKKLISPSITVVLKCTMNKLRRFLVLCNSGWFLFCHVVFSISSICTW